MDLGVVRTLGKMPQHTPKYFGIDLAKDFDLAKAHAAIESTWVQENLLKQSYEAMLEKERAIAPKQTNQLRELEYILREHYHIAKITLHDLTIRQDNNFRAVQVSVYISYDGEGVKRDYHRAITERQLMDIPNREIVNFVASEILYYTASKNALLDHIEDGMVAPEEIEARAFKGLDY